MAYLDVNGTEYEGKASFKFSFVADEKHKKKDKDGNETQTGVMTIYSNLLEKDVLYLSYFWECALAHHKKKPTLNDIQNALEEAAGEEEDYEALFQDAFRMIDNSGFFKGQVKKFWKNTEMMNGFGRDERENKVFESQLKQMKEARKELNPSITEK